jgi:DNA repair exonuclease SbcCD ATPase subunit
MASVSKGQDYIDSRDVMNNIEELENDREELSDAFDSALEAIEGAQKTLEEAEKARLGYTDPDDLKEKQEAVYEAREALAKAQEAYDEAKADLEEWDESSDADDLKDLKELDDMCSNEGEWSYGATLIHESAFEDHARQEAEDCGLLENCNKWPCTCIDWEQAADELKQDYTCIEWGDETYYMRA